MKIYNFLFEDMLSDLVKKFPENQEQLTKAKEMLGNKLFPKYLPWIAKVIQTTEEPIEDIVPVLLSFEKKKDLIKSKLGPEATDIQKYKDVASISNTLEQLNKKKEEKQQGVRQNILNNSDVLYSEPEDPWILVMPRTTQESCIAGSGTAWCVSRTESQNLFLNYVARKEENIILFFIINTEENPRKIQTQKFLLGL